MSDADSRPVWDRKGRSGGTRASTGGWLAIGIVAVIVICLLGAPQMSKTFGEIFRSAPEDAASRGPQLLGAGFGIVIASTLIWAGIVWAVIYFAFVRSRAPSRGPAYFIVLLVVGFLVNGVIMLGVSSVAQRDANDAQAKVFLHEVGSVVHNSKDLVSGKQALDTRIHAKGDAGIAEGVVKTLFARLLADRQAYREELKDIGLHELFSASHLAADPGLRRTRVTLEKAHDVVAKYRALTLRHFAEMRTMAENSAMSAEAKADFVRGVDSGMADSGAQIEQEWALEDGIITKMQSATAILTRGRWVARGNKILFSNPADMVAFNTKIGEIKADMEHEKAIQQTAVDRSIRTIDSADAHPT